MDNLNPARRELLRRRELLHLGGMGLAAAAVTAAPALAAPAKAPGSAAFPAGAIFDIRTFGAVGDGKT
ncbi:MAG TPA: hypothetical protein VIM60_10415, partial [Edaphobacter sp.]